MSTSASDDESFDSIKETSVNTKELRSRSVPINETDPALRSNIKEGVWPTKVKGVSLVETKIQKSVTVLSNTMSDTEEVVLSAESPVEWRSKMQKRHEAEMRAMRNQMRDKFTESMVKLSKDQRELREALDEAET